MSVLCGLSQNKFMTHISNVNVHEIFKIPFSYVGFLPYFLLNFKAFEQNGKYFYPEIMLHQGKFQCSFTVGRNNNNNMATGNKKFEQNYEIRGCWFPMYLRREMWTDNEETRNIISVIKINENEMTETCSMEKI